MKVARARRAVNVPDPDPVEHFSDDQIDDSQHVGSALVTVKRKVVRATIVGSARRRQPKSAMKAMKAKAMKAKKVKVARTKKTFCPAKARSTLPRKTKVDQAEKDARREKVLARKANAAAKRQQKEARQTARQTKLEEKQKKREANAEKKAKY